MVIMAFDAKRFSREKMVVEKAGAEESKRRVGFSTQLGAGVTIAKTDEFAKAYSTASQELLKSFHDDDDIPFPSSTYLKNHLGMVKAISFADQLISRVENLIESVHFSYVILPSSKISDVSVGGDQSQKIKIPRDKFIDQLGPMFSYLTAHSYLWTKKYDTASLQIYIDSFRSKHTLTWTKLVESVPPKIFVRGDESNPFISCADIMAFLTDVKLYHKHLRLWPRHIKEVWDGYGFDVTVHYFGVNGLDYYTWKDDSMIDFSQYIARPVVFLAIDNIEADGNDVQEHDVTEPVDYVDIDPKKPRKFSRVIQESDVYFGSLRYAAARNGSEDIQQKRRPGACEGRRHVRIHGNKIKGNRGESAARV